MRPWPIRMRIAIAFALAMAIVLAGTGVFVYERVGHDLAVSLDQELRLRAQDVAELARDPHGSLVDRPPVRLIERGESFAQLLTASGHVVDASSPLLADRPLLDARRRSEALHGSHFSNLPSIPGLDEGVRLLASGVRRGGRPLVLVVGATAENRAEALRNLREELLIAGPIALLLATALGYVLAGSGLRAVEQMRSRAERISADRPADRLPVPRTGDELQRLGETLNAMLGRLQGAVERERQFVADASHELRTPLALMRAELDYALHYARGEDELRAAIRTASEETDRLVALSGALLLIASSDRDGLRLSREELRAAELLDGIASRFSWRAQELGRRVVVVGDTDSLGLHADRLRLEQALGNLVDNGLRHGAGDVTLAAVRDGDAVVLEVRDHGRGFADDVLPSAFERFTRGDSPGAGLGLSIVRAIAVAHGGMADAENAQGGGARVRLRIPAA